MHTFQPYPVDLIEFDPFTKIGNDWMLITAGTKEKSNAMTASWGTVGVLWGKNVATIFVRENRYTKEFLDQNDTFSLNFFEHTYKSALKYFGAVSGRNEDKISNAKMNLDFSKDQTPYIDESNLVFLCRKMSATVITPDQFTDATLEKTWYPDQNLHTMYVGEITQILAR